MLSPAVELKVNMAENGGSSALVETITEPGESTPVEFAEGETSANNGAGPGGIHATGSGADAVLEQPSRIPSATITETNR